MYAQFRHPAAGAGAASAAAGAGAAHAPWFSRDDVLRQLAALGYTEVPESVLEEFMADLITMASSEAEAGRAPPIPGTPLAPSHSTAPAPTAPLGAAGAAAATPCVDVRSARQTPSRTRLSLGAPERVRVSTRNEGVLHHIPKSAKKKSDPGSARKRKTARGGGDVQTSFTREDGVQDMFQQLDQMSLRIKENVADTSMLEGFDTSFAYGRDGEFFDDQGDVEYEPAPLPEQSTTSWIKPREPRKIVKQDPVDRGRYYREMQKERRAPGEKSRSKLRWNVREKLRYEKEEPYTRPRTAPKVNTYVVPTEKKRMPLRWATKEYLNEAR